MTTPVNYKSLDEGTTNPFREQHEEGIIFAEVEESETPLNSGVMIHVVPDTTKTRWNHIEDLDSFFTRMYKYHQKHGFMVILIKEFFELLQFVFVVSLSTFLFHCVDYGKLFNGTKKSIYDVLKRMDNPGWFFWVMIILATIFWLVSVIRFIYHMIQYFDIKKFYNIALKIEDNELDNYTWHEVQKKVRDVQAEQQMCIHKQQLTELDIYHRILRFQNYLVAMMNKNLIQGKIYLPVIGEFPCLTKGLRYNIEILLFRGPFAPFENNWHLREEYKKSGNRIELARKISKQITVIAIGNLLFCPLILLFQLMYNIFSYGELFKREPSVFSANCWSQYGRLYLRHFNELDHELLARLNRAFRPATKYMASFTSASVVVVAKNLLFFCGAILVVLLVLTAYDEDVLQVESVITIISVLSMIVVVASKAIPDENLIFCPEQLLTTVLAHVHYLPTSWRGQAHTSRVRQQFSHFFQFRITYILTELASPILTPYILLRYFRPRSLDIVDFFRNFTVSVVGVGDVCSFAQMDVRKHGNPDWQLTQSTETMPQLVKKNPQLQTSICETNQYTQGENGKTELSLFHFTLTNPEWRMPEEAQLFVKGIKEHALGDIKNRRDPIKTATAQSLMTFGSIDMEFSSMANSIFLGNRIPMVAPLTDSVFKSRMYRHDEEPEEVQNVEQTPTYGGRAHAYDFEHMLQQNLHDEHPSYSGIGGVGGGSHVVDSSRYEPRQSMISDSNLLHVRRRNASKKEGRCEGPSDSILQSLQGPHLPAFAPADPSELTTADMCLSTLFLYELHHRQVERRGHHPPDQRQQRLWQGPHQTEGITPPSTSSSARVASASAERTPLLGQKIS